MFSSNIIRGLCLPGNQSLREHDKELFGLIEKELHRQVLGLELIASENFTSKAVMECLGSVLTNKYAEGLPYNRYYGGTEVVDQIETLCQKRALEAYRLSDYYWGVNVQPYSGSPANFAALTGLLKPHDRIMGLSLPCGGHLTHGFYTPKKKISASSVYFESLPYHTNTNGEVCFENLRTMAKLFNPKLIIAGGSAYTKDWDYKQFYEISCENKAFLMVDMAHISGLIAAEEHNNPFDYADVVTSTTHKSLRGPRSGLIFYRKRFADGSLTGYEDSINSAVFPGLQGGPHINQIAALCTQLKEVISPEFKIYIKQVKENCSVLAEQLQKRGYTLVGNGTENHLLLLNLNPLGITGSKMEKLFDQCSISVNKNTVPGDKSALSPGGLRLGTPALTTRSFEPKHFEEVAEFIHRGIQIGLSISKDYKKLTDFSNQCKNHPEVSQLKVDVQAYAKQFPFPGLQTSCPI